jgi:hypothetical protein
MTKDFYLSFCNKFFVFFALCSLFFVFCDNVLAIDLSDSAPDADAIRNFPTQQLSDLNKVGDVGGTGIEQTQTLIGRVVGYLVGFLGTLALALIVYAGFKFMLGGDSEEKQKEALKIMLWAGIGAVALLGSYSVVKFVFGIL